MGNLVDRHWQDLAVRMGSFLRGFDVPTVHLGSVAQFAGEFRKILYIRAIRTPSNNREISYAEAVRSSRLPPVDAEAIDPADPISILLSGLRGPMAHAGGSRIQLSRPLLVRDLSRMLRFPIMRFYLQLSDRERFFCMLEEIAEEHDFSLVCGARCAEVNCPICRSPLEADDGGTVRCAACGQTFEFFTPLPMMPAVSATISYDMLRKAVALESVECYQEEGGMETLDPGSMDL
jgi:LSD1 subclass zinc finger protein